jgi:hypothetical protein
LFPLPVKEEPRGPERQPAKKSPAVFFGLRNVERANGVVEPTSEAKVKVGARMGIIPPCPPPKREIAQPEPKGLPAVERARLHASAFVSLRSFLTRHASNPTQGTRKRRMRNQ